MTDWTCTVIITVFILAFDKLEFVHDKYVHEMHDVNIIESSQGSLYSKSTITMKHSMFFMPCYKQIF